MRGDVADTLRLAEPLAERGDVLAGELFSLRPVLGKNGPVGFVPDPVPYEAPFMLRALELKLRLCDETIELTEGAYAVVPPA